MTIKQLALAGGNQERDPYFNNVSLLLHGDGNNGGQNNTFLDSSGNNLAITRNGNVTQGTFSPFSAEPGKWSNYFDGSGDYLSIVPNTSLDLSTADFTIESYIYLNSSVHDAKIFLSTDGSNASNYWQITTQQGISIWFSGSSLLSYPSGLPNNRWVHFACTRSGNTFTFYIDGINVATSVSSANLGTRPYVQIGGWSGTSGVTINGNFSNYRIVKGIAVYTGNFTPPSKAPLATSGAASIAAYPSTTNVNTTFASSACSLLTCQDNRFKDNSLNNFTLTPYGDVKVTPTSPFAPSIAYNPSVHGGSGYFNGNPNCLVLPTNQASLALGNSDFTFEAWVYRISGTDATIFGGQGDGISVAGGAYVFYVSTTGGRTSDLYCGNSQYAVPSPDVPRGAWAHVAWVRSGGTFSSYLNGSRVGTIGGLGTTSVNVGATSLAPAIGGALITYAIRYLNGYISNARLIKGSGGYDATATTITIPTAPLTAIANTSLLCNFTNANIIDHSRKNDLETVGNAQVSTTTKKFGTGAMYFDGNGDVIYARNSTEFSFRTKDFTIECWLYLNTISGTQAIVSQREDGSLFFGVDTTGSTTTGKLFVYSSGRFSEISISSGSWNHVVCTRISNQYYVALNGIFGTILVNNPIQDLVSNYLQIGNDSALNPSIWGINGYIDDLRITKGIARYTANFIPPARSLPNQ